MFITEKLCTISPNALSENFTAYCTAILLDPKLVFHIVTKQVWRLARVIHFSNSLNFLSLNACTSFKPRILETT